MNIVFFGTESFAKTILESIIARPDLFTVVTVVTQPPRPAGRHQILTPSPVHTAATEKKIPVLTPESLRDTDIIETLHTDTADIFLVAQYGQIIPENILAIPRQGAVNVHASLLPCYRGSAPIHAALLAGDTQTGVSFMQMDAQMDHGPVFAQYAIEIFPEDTTPTLMARLAECATEHLAADLVAYYDGTKIPQEQMHTAATTVALLTKKVGYINWKTMDAALIERMTRAFDPWPGVTTSLVGNQIKFLRAHLITDQSPNNHTPGTLVIAPGETRFTTISGTLSIDVIQPAGKKPMSGDEFARGYAQFNGQVCASLE
ncbi:MAG: methionyl-tRNA formyltransferase [Candidatus Magasanikbacteria bacterium RIFCSPHIGHO2_01_FULL_50_8]|uniref:Methionyl-tRNA formyltransferase n=1 Tax=Candidatus Magasanikbacteria bacterium RIFCSPHIGHO2_01_FULL_50_8 TaxID=1798674 RepID=A0A1F6LNI6_9BACT|nr:MAG: methionyl-tRNA formyltransferase [Candidatus Magasanikbacteria bacterium RIFCSPHIGHO2_01_FULL_50_8]